MEGEIVITIDPRQADLDAFGVSLEEFEAALATTLDAYDQAMEATNDPNEISCRCQDHLGGQSTLRCC